MRVVGWEGKEERRKTNFDDNYDIDEDDGGDNDLASVVFQRRER